MKTNSFVSLLLCGILALNISGCATTTGNRAAPVHEARKKFRTRTTYAQGIGGGAIIGAAVGALAGGLLSGGKGWNPRGALIGALVGAGSGALVGGSVAHRKVEERKHYQQIEGSLDTEIQRTSNTRREAAKFNNTLSGNLKNVRAEANSQRVALADAKAVLATINSEIRRQNKNLVAARSNGVSNEDRARLNGEIRSLEAEREQLEGYIERLVPTNRPRLKG